jgi:Raf kinase inhibitor-like YbhB/YbcL family protein
MTWFFSGLALAGGPSFRVSSPDLAPGRPLAQAQLFDGFGCTGGNQSPALSWESAPAGTRSYAVTLYDPDAPTGSGWWHWVVFDLPASIKTLPADAARSLPAGARHARNDFGARSYGGACPPAGAGPHRYRLTVFALDVEHLDVPEDASTAYVGFLLHGHALAQATIEATYGR